MIDYKKVNKYLIELLMRGGKVYYGEYKDKIILTDSYSLWIIEKEQVFINLQLCNFIPDLYKRYIPDDYDYIDGYVTDMIQLSANVELREIVDKDNNISVKFNNKFYKFIKNVKFKINKPTKPILFYINDELAGLIIPVRIIV